MDEEINSTIDSNIIMSDNLSSKYSRLVIEFTKLREKHKLTKDILHETNNKLKSAKKLLSDKEIHGRNLEQEKESLLFRNNHLATQVTFLQSQIDLMSQKPNSRTLPHDMQVLQMYIQSQEAVISKAFNKHVKLQEELLSQSSLFLSRISDLEVKLNLRRSSYTSCSTQTLPEHVKDTTPLSLPSSSIRPAQIGTVNSITNEPITTEESKSSLADCEALPTNGSSGLESLSCSLEQFCIIEAVDLPPLLTSQTNGLDASAQSELYTLLSRDQTKDTNSQNNRSSSFPIISDTLEYMCPNELKSILPHHHPVVASSSQQTPQESMLLHRIVQLERQLAKCTVDRNLDLQRFECALKNYSPKISTGDNSDLMDLKGNLDSKEGGDALMAENNREALFSAAFEQRLIECNRELSLFIGRSTAAHKEVRYLHELLVLSRQEADHQMKLREAAEEKIAGLKQELDSTNLRAARQLSDMAMHLADMTDDIQALRSTVHLHDANTGQQNSSGTPPGGNLNSLPPSGFLHKLIQRKGDSSTLAD